MLAIDLHNNMAHARAGGSGGMEEVRNVIDKSHSAGKMRQPAMLWRVATQHELEREGAELQPAIQPASQSAIHMVRPAINLGKACRI